MNTRRAESLIRHALREGGSGVLFPAEPAGGGPTPVTGKAQSGGTLLPAVGGKPPSSAQSDLTSQINSFKKAQDDNIAAGNKLRPIGAPMNYNTWWNGKAPMTGPDSKFGDGSAYGRPGDGSAPARAPGGGGGGSTMGVARPPSLPYSGATFPSAPRGGGRSNVGSMSRSEHVEVRGGGGSAAPAGGGRGASRITERRTATIVMRPLDEGNPYATQPGNTPTASGSPYATQPGNTPYNGGGGGTPPTAPAAPAAAAAGAGSGASRGGTLLKAEPSGGSYGGGGPTAPRPGNTGSMGGGGGGMGGVLSSVGSAVLSTAGRAVGQAIQGNGKVDYAGMARNVGGYAAGTAVNGIAKSAMGAMGGGSSR